MLSYVIQMYFNVMPVEMVNHDITALYRNDTTFFTSLRNIVLSNFNALMSGLLTSATLNRHLSMFVQRMCTHVMGTSCQVLLN